MTSTIARSLAQQYVADVIARLHRDGVSTAHITEQQYDDAINKIAGVFDKLIDDALEHRVNSWG